MVPVLSGRPKRISRNPSCKISKSLPVTFNPSRLGKSPMAMSMSGSTGSKAIAPPPLSWLLPVSSMALPVRTIFPLAKEIELLAISIPRPGAKPSSTRLPVPVDSIAALLSKSIPSLPPPVLRLVPVRRISPFTELTRESRSRKSIPSLLTEPSPVPVSVRFPVPVDSTIAPCSIRIPSLSFSGPRLVPVK